MTDLVGPAADSEADIRWRNWQARGAEGDRRTATRIRRLMLVIATAFAIWLFVQFA